jgi:hypothetical protein
MGFLIDAVAHGFDRRGRMCAALTDVIIWLRLSSALMLQASSMEVVGCRLMQAVSDLFSRPVVDGVDSQA